MNHCKIFIEEDVNEMCSVAQVRYIEDLMKSNEEWYSLFLNNLCFQIHKRLSKQQACKLLDCLINHKEFEIVEKKR